MKTRADAEYVLSLFAERDEIRETAEQVLAGSLIAACGMGSEKPFIFQYLAGEARELVRREVASRVADIEKELQALGIEIEGQQ